MPAPNVPILERRNEPLLTAEDVAPSTAELEVLGVFNPGACLFGDETLLLLRVAERPHPEPGWLSVITASPAEEGKTHEVRRFRRDGPHRIDESDARHVTVDGQRYLTSLSHLRLARSRDGRHFMVSRKPMLFPSGEAEAYGIEDARVSLIGDRYHVTYTGVGSDGFGVCLATTGDFLHWQRHGVILPPENKNTCLLPLPLRGDYIALHRPSVHFIGRPSIWYAESPDLLHWGNHRCLLTPQLPSWSKIGAGPPPLRTSAGWLMLYHACDDQGRYSLHLALLDREDPSRVLALSPPEQPLLRAEQAWERQGFMPDVVFCNGWIANADGTVALYYGAADQCIGVATTHIEALLATLVDCSS